jgi:inosine-uridine nucleoside N-ribohydrolase
MRTRILLDTDIGSDIDDAVCLAYLLANPACELVGITTVTGEAARRAMLASVLCRAAGRDVPIFPGADNPILVPQKQTKAPQAAALARWDHQTAFPSGEAVPFLRETIRREPGEIILLTIGPLTNVGMLFAADPEIPSLLKGLVMMCGAFLDQPGKVRPGEWNASGDPHATALVYRAAVRVHRSVGLDVTLRVRLGAEETRKRFDHPLLRPVLDMAEVWFRSRPEVVFHDPLAAVSVFDDSVCRFRKGTVRAGVGTESEFGRTDWTEDPVNGPHEIATDVNAGLFFERYFSVFAATRPVATSGEDA